MHDQRPWARAGIDGIVTQNPRMLRQIELIRRFAGLDAPVVITGETGTGKELVAQALHALSPRAGRPFVTVDCAALPETLVESELFGHERGAFTGADRAYGGRVELAAGGTLFLDEVNSLSLVVQGKLLRFLEQAEFCRVGRQRPIPVDVRLIGACNVPLEQLVADGRMRADFYYRLKVLQIDLPPLRERREDIPLLARHFLAQDPLARRAGLADVSEAVLAALQARAWPGNVRELRNALRRAAAFADGPLLESLEPDAGVGVAAAAPAPSADPEAQTFRAWMAMREREYLLGLMRRYHSITQQAAASGLPQRTLYRKTKALRLGNSPGAL